jgi:LuxR family transcriptional regulator, maltose regulon positive regulatory protein
MESVLPEIPGTKLYMPRVRSLLVHRDRLTAWLEAGLTCTLTLVCAPAGFGKTTLLVDWLRVRESETGPQLAVAWVSLEDEDNDPVQFVRLLAAALRRAVPGLGETVLAMLRSPQPPPLKAPLTVLINEVLSSEREIILVLEDYHAIRQPPIHEGVAFLLEHLPPRLHVVIATREDPPLPLVQLRARGAVCELRAADLRFTIEETTAFLREVMELPVSAEDAATMHARTEGWIVGLQLAGLSVPARDVGSFVAALGGGHRNILDYLREEVLARQRPAIQSFLLRSAVLDRLSGPLCDAVLGDEQASQALLEEIERRNLFLMPLDAEGGWYRYHHLFADLLRIQLQGTQPAIIPELHRRASAWYERQGSVHPAIRHALAAIDFERAAGLIERHGLAAIMEGQTHTILGLIQDIPASLVQARPLLGTVYAFALAMVNRIENAEARLRDAELFLSSGDRLEDAEFIRGRIAILRALMVAPTGGLGPAVTFATEALRLLPARDVWGRSTAQVFAAYSFRTTGDASSQTERAVLEAARRAKAAGLPILVRVSLSLLGRLYMCQGRLRLAAARFTEAVQVSDANDPAGLPMSALGYGELLREWSDFENAEAFLQQGIEAVPATIVEAYVAAEGYISLARLRQARGDGVGAIAALDAFIALAKEQHMGGTVMARASGARAHLWLLQGDRAAALRWADTCGLGLEEPVSFQREPEYLTLARVLITKKSRAVLALLTRLLQDAERHGRMGSAIEIQVLRALALQALAEPAQALQALESALVLGEPEGYVRVFVDEGAPMATLLRRAYARGIAREYGAKLFGVFGDSGAGIRSRGPVVPSSALTPGDRGTSDLPVEPLTQREHEILHLLVTGASNEAIAQKLFISPGTVKAHGQRIIGKLGVKNRTQAVAKAKTLHLA